MMDPFIAAPSRPRRVPRYRGAAACLYEYAPEDCVISIAHSGSSRASDIAPRCLREVFWLTLVSRYAYLVLRRQVSLQGRLQQCVVEESEGLGVDRTGVQGAVEAPPRGFASSQAAPEER